MLKGAPPVPEVVGLYDEPAPDDAHGIIKSVQVADIGAVPLARAFTRWRDRATAAAGDLFDELVP